MHSIPHTNAFSPELCHEYKTITFIQGFVFCKRPQSHPNTNPPILFHLQKIYSAARKIALSAKELGRKAFEGIRTAKERVKERSMKPLFELAEP